MIKRDDVIGSRPESTRTGNKVEQLLDTTGDGTGTTQMAGASAIYKLVPPKGKEYDISRLNIYLEEDAKFRGDRYTATASLVDGIDVTINNAAGSLFRYTPDAVKRIGHWNLLAGVDVFLTDFAGGNDFLAIRWSFFKGSGYMILNGDDGEFLQFKVQDALTNMVDHRVQAQGTQRDI